MESVAWADHTSLHGLGLLAVILNGIALLVLPRRFAVIPLVLMACFVSSRQRVVVLSLDFTLLRILVMFGWIRLLIRGELSRLNLHALDFTIIAWVATTVIAATVREGTVSALVQMLGRGFDGTGMYFLLRALIRTWRDVRIAIGSFAVVSVPVVVAFVYEATTARNIFSVFGGVPEVTLERFGKLRCQGAFAHPIMAGCFWASMVPLMFGYAWGGLKDKILAAIGVSCATVIVVLSASSTPLAGLVAAGIAASLVSVRRQMRLVRWGLLGLLVSLHIVMKAPVWHLISRIDLVGGSTGWHRYHLIDQAIRRVSEWWLVGTSSTVHWGHLMGDVTNQYVLEGVRGGILKLGLFVAIIALAYRAIGKIWRANESHRERFVLAWALGCALFSHTMMFIAASYFGQTYLVWYLLLAMIGSVVAPVEAARRNQRVARVAGPALSRPGPAHAKRQTGGRRRVPVARSYRRPLN